MKRELFAREKTLTAIFVAAGLILLYVSPAAAAIAKISRFNGTVTVQHESSISKVSQAGVAINSGDSVTTQEGEAYIVFTDGAVTKLSPYTCIQIIEYTEESGTWIFKTSYNARRIMCIVGKIWFKSGASNTKNYLQSPKAITLLRGSDGDFGFDNVTTYINMYTGANQKIAGQIIQGFFQNPGIDAATKNTIYQAAMIATQQTAQVSSAPNSALRSVLLAQAQVTSTRVLIQMAQATLNTQAPGQDQTAYTGFVAQYIDVEGTLLRQYESNLQSSITAATQQGFTVTTTTTTTVPATTVPATTTAASTTSTSTTSTTSTTSSLSTTTICPSPPCH